MSKDILFMCKDLLNAYEQGLLGDTTMPDDTNPGFSNKELEQRLSYFTLPMSLNYQRDSYKLWEAALKTYTDKETSCVFDIVWVSNNTEDALREKLTKYGLALQPNKHINTWYRISNTVFSNWGSFNSLLEAVDHDFLQLRQLIQKDHKKGFPYLSGPKIFNYWSHILMGYCEILFKNSEFIEIAPDTHVLKASVKLGVITGEEAKTLSKEEINAKWRDLLEEFGITPIQMHSPLWFWSRGGFKYDPKCN